MRNKKIAFLKILAIELNDLEEDIKAVMEEYKEKHDHSMITNYVFYENLSVLQRELFGVDSFVEEIGAINPDDYATIEVLIKDLYKKLQDRIKEKCLVPAVLQLVDRKMKKVALYIGVGT